MRSVSRFSDRYHYPNRDICNLIIRVFVTLERFGYPVSLEVVSSTVERIHSFLISARSLVAVRMERALRPASDTILPPHSPSRSLFLFLHRTFVSSPTQHPLRVLWPFSLSLLFAGHAISLPRATLLCFSL